MRSERNRAQRIIDEIYADQTKERWLAFFFVGFAASALASFNIIDVWTCFYCAFCAFAIRYVATKTEPAEPDHLTFYRIFTSVILICLFYFYVFKTHIVTALNNILT